MSTGHYGGASMALPMAALVVFLFACAPWVIVLIILAGLVLIGLAAVAAAFAVDHPRRR